MSRPCSACTSPRRAEIDSALAAGATCKAVAATVGLNAGMISRHKRKCLQSTSLTDAEQLKLWASRAEEAYLMSGANADVKSMCAALAAGLRSVELSLKRKEELQQSQAAARDFPTDLKEWSEAERARMRDYIDHCIANADLPDFMKAGEHHARELLPIRGNRIH
jgi:hypothetical protein